MTCRTLTYSQDEFWLRRIEEVNLERSSLFRILKFEDPEVMEKLEEERIAIEVARGQSDDLKVVDSLESSKGQIAAYNNIGQFNQLGLKDYLRGKSSPQIVNVHTRWAHSAGTALIGRLYFSALEPFIKYTTFKDVLDDVKRYYEKSMSFALYLHDVGHLPYSHMIEGIFNEVNWTRIKGAYHRHDEAPLEQLDRLEKKGIMAAIKGNLDFSSEDEAEQTFDFVQDLIAGISGIPFLDAIVNSSIDADKIDYIFRDMEYTETRSRLRETKRWLTDFLSSISLSPEGLVRLNGEASICALELLEERQFLYRTLYLDPMIRAFEKIASVIIISWLTKEISSNLLEILKRDSGLNNLFRFRPDVRRDKGNLAYEKVGKKFLKHSSNQELTLLLEMCEELANDGYRDGYSRNWFKSLKARLEGFMGVESLQRLVKEYNEIIVQEPFYIRRGTEDKDVTKAREIARNLYIDYPCGVLIDIAEFPRFLPSPKSRRFRTHNREVVSETFLVPDEEPRRWSRNKIGKFPLHRCDFGSLEKDFAQVVVINTMPREVNGVYFFDLFSKRCRECGVQIESSIWR